MELLEKVSEVVSMENTAKASGFTGDVADSKV